MANPAPKKASPAAAKKAPGAAAKKASATSAAQTPLSSATRRATPRTGKGAVASGAARASGERAKRRSTPLLAPTSDLTVPAPTSDLTVPAPTAKPASPHRPHPKARAQASAKATKQSGIRTQKPRTPPARGTRGARRDPRAVRARDEAAAPRHLAVAPPPVDPTVADTDTSLPVPGIEELLSASIMAMRIAAQGAGMAPDEVEHKIAALLAFVRRRVEGDYTVDEFGFDEDFADNVVFPLLRPLYQKWFRVEVRGIENIPAEGGALIVSNHSGTVAIDSLMVAQAIHDEHPSHRVMRALGADLVFQTPFLGPLARRSGATLATNADVDRLFAANELVGVFPEGFKGVGKPFRERYKLQRFGRGGFVTAALKAGVPIIPTSVVGAEEIAPILGNMKTVARVLGLPYLPITPTFPLLGPLGLIPLPSKWIIEFGAPIDTAEHGSAAAEDPMVVFDLTDQVRETIQQTLYSLLMQRRSVFF